MPEHWVVNASPLITLAKARHLALLTALATEVLIPEAVVAEVRVVRLPIPPGRHWRAWAGAHGSRCPVYRSFSRNGASVQGRPPCWRWPWRVGSVRRFSMTPPAAAVRGRWASRSWYWAWSCAPNTTGTLRPRPWSCALRAAGLYIDDVLLTRMLRESVRGRRGGHNRRAAADPRRRRARRAPVRRE